MHSGITGSVRSRYELAHDREWSATVESHAHKPTSRTQGVDLPEDSVQDGGLTNRILAGLTATEFNRLVPYLQPAGLQSGEVIRRSQQSYPFIYFPESAVISHLYTLRNGGATAAAVIGSEGVVGLSAIVQSHPPVYDTKVMIGGDGLRVRVEVIREEFARGKDLQRLILTYVRKRLTQVSQRAVCNGRHKLAERLCTWLLMIDDRTSNVAIPLIQADIANHLGARRTVITARLHDLRRNGAITYKRGAIIVLDRKILEIGACECYQVLKQ
jgi:CRP-like cAMP-binding protein